MLALDRAGVAPSVLQLVPVDTIGTAHCRRQRLKKPIGHLHALTSQFPTLPAVLDSSPRPSALDAATASEGVDRVEEAASTPPDAAVAPVAGWARGALRGRCDAGVAVRAGRHGVHEPISWATARSAKPWPINADGSHEPGARRRLKHNPCGRSQRGMSVAELTGARGPYGFEIVG